jgi:ketosteroid isomerase-like protein
MSGDGKVLIEEANAGFYRAMESGLIEQMEEVWAHEDYVRCVHPGWDALTGWQRVRESFVMIFSNGQKMKASPLDVSIFEMNDIARVCCTENITVFTSESFDSAQATATNLFVRREGRWLLVHHHASSIPMIVSDESSNLVQ